MCVMNKFIRLFILVVGIVTFLSSCQKDEDIEGGKPYSLVGTTWTSPMSENKRYTSFRFFAGHQYEERTLDQNAVLIDVSARGRYVVTKYRGRWTVDFYEGDRIRNSLFIYYDEGYMTEGVVKYRKQ